MSTCNIWILQFFSGLFIESWISHADSRICDIECNEKYLAYYQYYLKCFSTRRIKSLWPRLMSNNSGNMQPNSMQFFESYRTLLNLNFHFLIVPVSSCPCLVKGAIIHAKTRSRAFRSKVRKISSCDRILMIKKRKFQLKRILEDAKNCIEFS